MMTWLDRRVAFQNVTCAQHHKGLLDTRVSKYDLCSFIEIQMQVTFCCCIINRNITWPAVELSNVTCAEHYKCILVTRVSKYDLCSLIELQIQISFFWWLINPNMTWPASCLISFCIIHASWLSNTNPAFLTTQDTPIAAWLHVDNRLFPLML